MRGCRWPDEADPFDAPGLRRLDRDHAVVCDRVGCPLNYGPLLRHVRRAVDFYAQFVSTPFWVTADRRYPTVWQEKCVRVVDPRDRWRLGDRPRIRRGVVYLRG